MMKQSLEEGRRGCNQINSISLRGVSLGKKAFLLLLVREEGTEEKFIQLVI